MVHIAINRWDCDSLVCLFSKYIEATKLERNVYFDMDENPTEKPNGKIWSVGGITIELSIDFSTPSYCTCAVHPQQHATI